MENSLTEPYIKYYIKNTLKQCREYKDINVNIFFNIAMTVLFILIISVFLYTKYKGRLSSSEIVERNKNKHHYIISKLKMFQQHKHNEKIENGTMITNLPLYEPYEV
jgi:hypothetical protein